jgi:hypothetical protein
MGTAAKQTAWTLAVVACLVVLPTVARAGSTSSGVARVSPKHVVLRVNDVPVGFTDTTSGPFTLTKVAKLNYVSVATMKKKGYLSSWETVFQREAFTGLVGISDDVVAFRSTAGAKWQVQQSKKVAQRQYGQDHLQPLAVGRIGDAALGDCFEQLVNGLTYTTCFALFRHGAYVAFVAAAGFKGTFDHAVVAGLAKTMNRRIGPAKARPTTTPVPTKTPLPTVTPTPSPPSVSVSFAAPVPGFTDAQTNGVFEIIDTTYGERVDISRIGMVRDQYSPANFMLAMYIQASKIASSMDAKNPAFNIDSSLFRLVASNQHPYSFYDGCGTPAFSPATLYDGESASGWLCTAPIDPQNLPGTFILNLETDSTSFGGQPVLTLSISTAT